MEVIIYMDSNKKVTPKVIWPIVGTAGLACSGVLVETSMNVTFPTLMRVFKQPLNNIQWITTAYLLAVTLTIFLAAYTQRSFSFKKLVIAAGICSIVGGLIALTLAVNNLSKGLANPLVWGGLLITIAAFWAFFTMAKQEGKAHIINTTVFKNISFNLVLAIYTCLQFIQISLTFVIPNLAQLGLKTSALASGMLLLLGSLLSAFFGPVMGRLLDSQGFKKLFIIGSLLGIAGIGLFIVFAQKLSIVTIIIFHVLFMTGFSMMYNNSMTIGLQQLEVHHIADGNALFNMLQQYSGSIGTAAMSVIIAIAGSSYQGASQQTIMGSKAAFIALFLFTLIIGACVLGLIKREQKRLLKD